MKALYLSSPMDQFEIKPFFGDFLGLIYTPLGFITNMFIYFVIVILMINLLYIHGGFKSIVNING